MFPVLILMYLIIECSKWICKVVEIGLMLFSWNDLQRTGRYETFLLAFLDGMIMVKYMSCALVNSGNLSDVSFLGLVRYRHLVYLSVKRLSRMRFFQFLHYVLFCDSLGVDNKRIPSQLLNNFLHYEVSCIHPRGWSLFHLDLYPFRLLNLKGAILRLKSSAGILFEWKSIISFAKGLALLLLQMGCSSVISKRTLKSIIN